MTTRKTAAAALGTLARAAPCRVEVRCAMAFLFPTARPAAVLALLVGLAGAGPAVAAPPTVADPWVRATVPQQTSSAFYARITSASGGRLVGVSSPVAGVAELHTMSMEGHVMRMRAVPAVELPAGKAVALEPGGYHVMLMDLRQQLKAGDTVSVSLVVEGADGRRETVEVAAAVRPLHGGAMKH
jgi:copper(I)-binding protein